MTFNDQEPFNSPGEILNRAATTIGLTHDQMADLLESELDVDQLLAYITAVVQKRMN